jgi:tRNA uridine 5-carboxymethylaminomethyl modification enzyme
MFTSRAEFRLHLRIDNADERLTPAGRRAGLVCDRRWNLLQTKQEQKRRLLEALNTTRITPAAFPDVGLAAEDRPVISQWIRRPESSLNALGGWARDVLTSDPVPGLLHTIETEAKYAGYVQQQDRQIGRLRDAERHRIPMSFCFHGIPGLSREVQEKLERVRPETLAQASRIPGVTPAAVAVLEVYLRLGPRQSI